MPKSLTIGFGDPAVITSDNPTETELKTQKVRAERNALLAESDKMMVPDRLKGEVKEAWTTYRQSLRDMDFSDPNDIIWPTKPE